MTSTRSYRGRAIKSGNAQGAALVSPAAVGFFVSVDPETGTVIEPGHPLAGGAPSARTSCIAWPRRAWPQQQS